ncbi:MAG: hypothetical protein PVI91_12820, partial [Gammaproteobacteria bacterium]
MDMDQRLHLLIVEESRNDAEGLANILRNAGQASRLSYAGDRADVANALDRQLPDLVLCASRLDTVSISDVVLLLEQRELAT